MKKFILILWLQVACQVAFAQFTDSFTDGDFTNAPTWSGNDAVFTVDANQLRSNSPSAATYYLSTPSTKATEAQWEFFINLQFATSGSNYVDVLLTSDVANLTTTNNGYFVRIGNTGDEVVLYKVVGGVITALINSPAGIVNSSSNNPFKIKVTRNASNLWNLEYDDGNTGTFVSAGTITDNSLNTSSFFGIRIIQSSAASVVNNHFFDDFEVGDIVLDLTPPGIQSLSVISATELDVLFDEPVSLATAQTASNYSVNNGIGTPSGVVRDAGNQALVHLTFANSFGDGVSNQITINGVQDLSGNAISSAQANFTYVMVSNASAGDLIINEIMADPTPQVGLPNAEYVEIYNKSTKNIDLRNYTLNTRTITNSSFILLPNQYVLLCPSANASEFTGNVIGMASFDALTNSGETITLRDVNNALDVDIVSYTDAWYKDGAKRDGGYSLERINPTLVCSGENNWIASNDASGGTPARVNSVLNNTPDTSNPLITNVSVIGTNQLLVQFNEVLQAADLNGATYTVGQSALLVTSAVAQTGNQEVLLTFDTDLTLGVLYRLTITNLSDCAGNPLTDNQVSFGAGITPTFHQVIITEIMADPDPVIGLPELEYIEIYNTTSQVVQLQGCMLVDASKLAVFPNFNLLPNQYVVVSTTSNVDDFSVFGTTIGLTNFPSLTNSGKNLTLLTPSGKTMFTVTYSDDWYRDEEKKNGGYSLEMIDVQAPCVESINWIASNDATGGTPARENSIQEPRTDNIAPQLVRADAINDSTIVLQFNEKLDSLSITTATYAIDPSVTIDSIRAVSPNFQSIIIYTTGKLAIKTNYTITITNVADCSGNLIAENNVAIFGVPEQAEGNDIILNEILFNPRTGGSDFIEIYNNSDKFINLKNWQLANIDEGVTDNFRIITEEDFILQPNSYLAITTDIENVQTNYPASVGKPFLEIPSMPSYNDDEGSVILVNNLEEEVQRFDYNEDFHFDLIDDEEGVSLERISFNAPVNDANSWFSAASTVGFATPGYENSQRKLAGDILGGIKVSPKAFAPDNDGFSDFVTIDYSFAQSGYTANIIIYDNKGREVKRLAQNQLLATSGFFTWDGTNNERAKVRTGYFVILFQVFDLSGNEEGFKQTVAVTERF